MVYKFLIALALLILCFTQMPLWLVGLCFVLWFPVAILMSGS